MGGPIGSNCPDYDLLLKKYPSCRWIVPIPNLSLIELVGLHLLALRFLLLAQMLASLIGSSLALLMTFAQMDATIKREIIWTDFHFMMILLWIIFPTFFPFV
jgi:hypothetical protein